MHIPIQRVFTTVARNLGLKDFKAHIDSWVEWAFEAEKHIGSLDTLIEKQIDYNQQKLRKFLKRGEMERKQVDELERRLNAFFISKTIN